MKAVVFCLTVVCLYATDIHKHGLVTSYPTSPKDQATIISFSNGIVFDTRNGEPDIPSHLKVDSQTEGYYLVQLTGPIHRGWVNALVQEGAQLLSYMPNYAYIVHAKDAQIVRVANKAFVRWTGIYHPAYKIAADLLENVGFGRVTIQISPIESAYDIAQRIEEMDCDLVEIIDHDICKTIDVFVDFKRLNEVARLSGVLWIQRWFPAEPANENCQWVVQTGWQSSIPPDSIGRRIWHKGLRGQGIILSTSDSGIWTEHDMFFDSQHPINAPGIYQNHRKIIAYKVYGNAAFGEYMPLPHGTFGACNVAGNDTVIGMSNHDGMAKEARIYFLDVADTNGNWFLPSNLAALYDSIYPGTGLECNILQHSGSWGWGNSVGYYLTQDAISDAYLWEHREFLNIFAAGNNAQYRRVLTPGISKNVITLGGTYNGISSNTYWGASSSGPTQDNRIKPNFVAPASVYSAHAIGPSNYIENEGTSWSTTAVNGAIGLIRQYLLAGFYPSGTENPADSIRYQSSALLRAMAIVSCDPNVGSYVVPDSNIGWGRIDLDSVLYFDGDLRKLIILDDTIGVNTGQSITDSFIVNSDIPLRVCLAWTDTAAAVGANPTLVNDLNLELTAPNGTYYRGNQYSGGQSIPDPAGWDDRNVEECIRVDTPELGTWYITVGGQNIPYGTQPIAYAITGDVQTSVNVEEYGKTVVQKTAINLLCSIIKNRIYFEITLHSPTKVLVRMIDVSGRVVHTIVNTRLPAGTHSLEHSIELPSGVYFLKLTAGDYSATDKLLLIK
jgi:hypothetical protein